MSIALKVMLFLFVGLILLVLFAPSIRQSFTRVFSTSETIVFQDSSDNGSAQGQTQEFELVTLLGYDAIPAILDPRFVDAAQAEAWMDPDEQVLGLSINGDSRAYSVRMLSRHEIVNDVVGGVPVAVTW